MLTQVIGTRVYDFSYAAGRRDLAMVIGVAASTDDTVYLLTRPSEIIPDAPWDRTGSAAKVGKYTFGPEWGSEELLLEFGKYGQGDGQFIWPSGIALDSGCNVYVADEWLNRVVVHDPDGNFLGHWGEAGSGPGGLNRPSGIASDADDNLYVVDGAAHRVQKFTTDGAYIAGWGGHGSGEGQLDSPWGIAVGPDGNVYMADHKNHRVQKFAPDGGYITSFGSYGTGRGELNRPSDVAVDPDGDVYVCDWANSRVQIFAPDGKFVTSLIGDAQRMAMWQQMMVDANADVVKARRRVYTLEPEWRFALPTGLDFDSAHSRLIVADTQRARVQIYNKLDDYIEPQYNL